MDNILKVYLGTINWMDFANFIE